VFRGFDAKIGSRVHSDGYRYGQKSVLSSRISKNHGTRFLYASSKTRGCLGASFLSSMDTLVRTMPHTYTYISYNSKKTILRYTIIVDFT